MGDNGVVAGGRLTDQITLGVLAAGVPRDAVDDAVAAAGKQARRRDGKLPPHVVYFTMAMALFSDGDYEEVAARLAGTLASWGCWDDSWSVPTSGGITQARQRLGYEPLAGLLARVAEPVAGLLTRGAFLAGRRLMSIDGFGWDAPDTPASAAEFGYAGKGAGSPDRPAFPKARVVTVSECASHVVVDAEIGGVAGKGTGEQALARRLYARLDRQWLLIADRNFYNWQDWRTAAGTGAALLWRVRSDLRLPLIEALPDGSYLSVLIDPKVTGRARERILQSAQARNDLDAGRARYVRVIEYEIPDRGGGELIALVTTITDPREAPAATLAEGYQQRWEHETGNDQLKTHLRGPGKVLRSRSPDMVRQEIYGYLLTHYAISALICQAATEAGIDPDRVKFTRTVRVVRQAIAPAAFPPSAP